MAANEELYEDPLNEQSDADQPVSWEERMEQTIFLGDTPFSVILESIENQFQDYINMEDDTNYVDLFYEQLHASYDALEKDEEEEHPEEARDVLDHIRDQFLSKMETLFAQRLTLTIMALDAEAIDEEEAEYVIRKLYEFFILGARENFKSVIAKDVNAKILTLIEDDTKYFETVKDMLTSYSPLVTAIGPMEFLKYQGDQEVYDLFDDGKVTGNFLRKYSPKLYQNEEYEVELINYITMYGQLKEELIHG